MRGFSEFETWFIWLIFYSVVGWVYETILCSVNEKRFINRGFLNGPYCPIYGSGALLDILVLGRIQNPALLFILGVLLTCTLEYLTSWAMEKLFHARWWDYSDKKFNLNGRVCLLGAVVFGSFSVLLILGIHPFVRRCTERFSPLALHLLFGILFAAFTADCIVTLLGVSSFNKKLRLLTAELAEHRKKIAESADERRTVLAEKLHQSAVYKSVSAAMAGFEKQINFQERRMLHAFPKYRSQKYNEALVELRDWLKKQREQKRVKK